MSSSSDNRRPASISAFDVWVGENNPPLTLEYSAERKAVRKSHNRRVRRRARHLLRAGRGTDIPRYRRTSGWLDDLDRIAI